MCCIENSKTVKNINAQKEMIHHKQKNLFMGKLLGWWVGVVVVFEYK